ncbi:MAG TPA: hypothetical protein VK968_05830 [Roseimicrobium sp.]|nr:hypothetical protein [Roseimicrobium sp.]
MKVLVLILSLLVNVALFATITWRASRPDPAMPQVVGKSVISALQTEKKVVEVQIPSAAITQNWSQVEAPEYPAYIKNLREIHCPEETIRDIIVSDVMKLYGQRFHESRSEIDPPPNEYWQPRTRWKNNYTTPADASRERSKVELTRERRDLIRSLLDVDLETELTLRSMEDPETSLDTKLAFLSEGQRREVKAIHQRFHEDLELLQNEPKEDGYSPEQFERYKKLRSDWESGLDHWLSPSEKEMYMMSGSHVGDILRSFPATTSGLSQDEFHKLFKLLRPFEIDMMENQMSPANEIASKAFQARAERVIEEANKVIGAGRFKEIETSQEGSYRQFAGLANRYSLPEPLPRKAFDIRKAAEEQAQKLKDDPSLSPDQKKNATKIIASETERALIQVFGVQPFDWHKRVDGDWLKNLTN